VYSQKATVVLTDASATATVNVTEGAQWISVSRRNTAPRQFEITTVVNGTSACRQLATVVGSQRSFGAVITVFTDQADGVQYRLELPATIVITVPQVLIQPQSLFSMVRKSSTNATAEAMLTITGLGVGSVVAGIGVQQMPVFRFCVSPSTSTISSGQSQDIKLTAVFIGDTPDIYTTTVVVFTNTICCDGSLVTSSVPWTIQVADLMFVPTAITTDVSPDATDGVSFPVYLANFAGRHATCIFNLHAGLIPFQLSESVSVNPRVSVIAPGQMEVVNVEASYPTQLSMIASEVNVNLTAQCASANGDVLGSSVSRLYLRFTKGQPYPPLCAAEMVAHSPVLVGSKVVLNLVLRDRAGNSLKDATDISSAATVRFIHSSGTVVAAKTTSLSLAFSPTNEPYFELITVASIPHGSYWLQVLIGSDSMLYQPLNVTQLQCREGQTVDVSTFGTCVCSGGYYRSDGGDCAPCPRGSYKRNAGNTTYAGCAGCPAEWYCESGSVTPTGRCPGVGYTCQDGVLAVQSGYAISSPNALTAELAMPVPCSLRQACPGNSGVCEAGYVGEGCHLCAPGYVSFQAHCRQCEPVAMGVIMLLVWVVIVTCISGVITTLQHEESGVGLGRLAWIGMHGQRITRLFQTLFQFLCLSAAQLVVPSQIPLPHLSAFLSVVGSAVSPGLWPPTMCVLSNSTASLLLPIIALVPLTALSTGLSESILLAPIIWRKVLHTRQSVMRRFWTAFRGLVSSFYLFIV
jgi:hypothetical protein